MDKKQLPHSLEAERAVLGGLLLGAFSYSSATQILKPDDFFREAHAIVFQTMVEMINNNEPVEVASVVNKILANKQIDEVGGVNYVASLITQTASIHNTDYYASLIREASTKRKLLTNFREVIQRVTEENLPLPDIFDLAESKLFEVTQNSDSKDWQEVSVIVDQEFHRIQQLMNNQSDVSGITSGFIDLDKKLAGFQRTDLVILAARPAMGKTALALNFLINAAKSDVGVGMFSLEMSAGQLVTRLLCLEGKVDAGRVRTGFISRDSELPRLVEASDTLYSLPIYLDDEPGLNITQLRSKARRLVSTYKNIGIIIIDYIGLMTGDNKLSRQEQVSASSRGLKALAKELNVCVIALSQLNRGVESRTDKRPMPSDLRESGAIEQDADIIMFIYRDEYYNETTTPEPGVAEIIVAKQRNGSTGTVKLAFQKEFTRFENLVQNGGEYL